VYVDTNMHRSLSLSLSLSYSHRSLSLSLSHTHTGHFHLRDTKARLLSTAGPTDGLADMDVALVAENALFTVTTAFALSRVRSYLNIH